jgi:hypothetical protein
MRAMEGSRKGGGKETRASCPSFTGGPGKRNVKVVCPSKVVTLLPTEVDEVKGVEGAWEGGRTVAFTKATVEISGVSGKKA